ncbi:circadian clock-controlled protein daywake-like [Epargyreus clarus]|uniref:circadian clock-controlled protein daywake-like n=1 Tax=Epargyreus clarus TaxID=520877 RepID=UPI003C2BDE85
MISSVLKVLILIQFTTIFCAVPQLSRKCKISDSSCILGVAQDVLPIITEGIPELGTKPLDEMYIDKNMVDLAGLKLTVTDAYIKGLKQAVIKHISFDKSKNVLKIAYTSNMDMKSKYVASGQLLVLPISGNGDMKINLKTLEVEMTIPFNIVKNKDGKDTMELKSYKFKFDVKGGAHFDLTNLFNGDKRLSTAMLKFMNENWRLLSETFGRPMLDKVHKEIFEAIKTYLRSVPMEELFDN